MMSPPGREGSALLGGLLRHVCQYEGCGKSFRHIQHLRRHQTQKHGRTPRQRYQPFRDFVVLPYSGGWSGNQELEAKASAESLAEQLVTEDRTGGS